MCREIRVSHLKTWLLQLRIKIFIACLLRNTILVRILVLLLQVWSWAVLYGGWNVCWIRWLSWVWQCWDPHEVTNKIDFFKVLVESRFSVPHHFGASFPFLVLLQVQVSQPTPTALPSIRNLHMEAKTSDGWCHHFYDNEKSSAELFPWFFAWHVFIYMKISHCYSVRKNSWQWH